jgi:hypothetical protein
MHESTLVLVTPTSIRKNVRCDVKAQMQILYYNEGREIAAHAP